MGVAQSIANSWEASGGASPRRCPSSRKQEEGRGNADNPAADLSATRRLDVCLDMAGLRKSLRKEVIQPQVLLRLPCYDLVPVTDLAVDTTVMWRLRALPAPMT